MYMRLSTCVLLLTLSLFGCSLNPTDRARFYEEAGDYSMAIRCYEEALRSESQQTKKLAIYMQLSSLYARTSRDEIAQSRLDDALTIISELPEEMVYEALPEMEAEYCLALSALEKQEGNYLNGQSVPASRNLIAEVPESGDAVDLIKVLPKLKVSYTRPSGEIERGKVVEIGLNIVNEGTGTAKAVVLSVDSEDVDIPQGEVTLGALAPGERKTASISVTIPNDAEGDIVNLRAIAADADGRKSNLLPILLPLKSPEVRVTFPKLKISYIDPPGKIGRGKIEELSLSVMNEGTGSAKTVIVYIDSEALQISQMNILGVLAPGEQKTVTILVTIPDEVRQNAIEFTAVAVDANGHRSNEPRYVAQVLKIDTTAPVITLIEPLISRGVKITYREKTMRVRVRATDESGILKVTVNGEEAQPLANDEYETEIGFGDTESDITISVMAEDIYGNIAPLNFDVHHKPLLVSQRWAVVIGVSIYKDSRIPSLRYAARDAQAFYDWLISQQGGRYAPARVKCLLDENATLQNIKDALFIWLKQAIAEDMVTIYFSGHGSPESPDDLENLFLLPWDADYDKIGSTGFPMWDMETAFEKFIQAKKAVIIADACHAGGVGSGFVDALKDPKGFKPVINTAFQDLTKLGDGIVVLTASDDKQFSRESDKWGGGHGVFTWCLLNGLKGEADYSKDGRVTLGELIPYLSEQVRRETQNSQSPTVAGKFDPAISIGR